MDPMNRGPEDHGHHDTAANGAGTGAVGTGGAAARPRAPRDELTPGLGQPAPAATARTAQLISGDFLLTVNPVDGSEIEPCPPGRHPEPPARHTRAERAEIARAAAPPVPPGPPAPRLPLLDRQEERERLVRLLSHGRSVRLTGPAGSGRTSLLDIVADDCADLAPDGVVRLSGRHRTPTELLYELVAAVHRVPAHRPDRAGLLALVREIGAVVLVDDLEFGGGALDELLDAAPECAFLLATSPAVAAPSADAAIEEVFLPGLGRGSTLELLERGVDRALTDDEANWAGDLWFESEGLPVRFVQAGALLRQRDELRAGPGDPDDDDTENVFTDVRDVLPLPSVGEGAAPAVLLASRLSESARETLRFAVALGGEIPHQAHLPALVGDTHADAAVGELLGCGLLTPVGSRYRLANGVTEQLVAGGYGEGAVARAHTAAQHYAWWVAHPSVTPARAAAEADAVLAALAALVPSQEAGHASAAVLLARGAAPAFAAGLHWNAWERTLRSGQEAARIAGEVAEEAYFHHELGVLALCAGNLDRARAELEASIGMRGALADKRGTVAGRRALALVADRERGIVYGGLGGALDDPPATPPAGSPGRGGGAVAPTPANRGAGPLAKGPGGGAPTPGGPALGAGGTGTSDIGASAMGTSGMGPAGTGLGGTAHGAGAHGAGVHAAGAFGVTGSTGRTEPGPGSGGTAPTLVSHTGPPAGRRRPFPVLTGTRRNLVAAGAGAVLAAVLGTVVTLGATSGGEPSGTGTGTVTTDRTPDSDGSGSGGLDTDTPDDDSAPADDTGDTPVQPGSSAQPGGAGSGGAPSAPGTPTSPGATASGSGSGSATTSPSVGGSGSPSTSGTPTSGGGSTGGTDSGGSGSGGTDTGGTDTGGTDTGGTTSGGTPTGGSDSGGTTSGGDSGGTDTTGGVTTSGGAGGGTTTGGDSTGAAGGGTTPSGSAPSD
ncbi:ATP-binding protein [Streptomyces sp. NPDC047928]|uniref:ATP-binding protein n=1 Tax=unclassified Streptomyces TaxID=2593676 RepID=UPI00371E810D